MSLISSKDRNICIAALETYKLQQSNDTELRMEINALINWLKLENYKKGN